MIFVEQPAPPPKLNPAFSRGSLYTLIYNTSIIMILSLSSWYNSPLMVLGRPVIRVSLLLLLQIVDSIYYLPYSNFRIYFLYLIHFIIVLSILFELLL